MYCWSLAWWILSITQSLGGHTQNLLCTKTQDKGAVIPQETDPNLPVSVQESPVEAWVSGGLLKGQGTECSSVCMDLLNKVTIVFITSTIVWPQIKQQGGNSPAHQQKIGFKISWAWPHPSEQDWVLPSITLSHQEASLSLLSLSIRGQTEWKPQSQKTNQSDHVDHSLV